LLALQDFRFPPLRSLPYQCTPTRTDRRNLPHFFPLADERAHKRARPQKQKEITFGDLFFSEIFAPLVQK